MPQSFTQLSVESGGEMLFTSDQSDVLEFLGAPGLGNWGGMCLALVMMWLNQESSMKRPDEGIPNKAAAVTLQAKMEGNWKGLDTAIKESRAYLLTKTYWWASSDLHVFSDFKEPAPYLQNDPHYGRDGLHILVIYFNDGPAHAIGVWRFPSAAMVLYDPNHGACVQSAEAFPGFLTNFFTNLYENLRGFAIVSFCSKPE